MAVDKIFNESNIDNVADNLFSAVSNSVSEVKAMQQRKAAENVQVVIEALRKIEGDMRGEFSDVADKLAERITSIKDGKDGLHGVNGKPGRDGRAGKDGTSGSKGNDGLPGRHGIDGVNGVSVTNAYIDFDGSLIINLSSGQVLNVGEVVSQDLAESIKIITSGGAGGAGGTVTSVSATGGTGISVTGSPITTSGTLNIVNTAPDQVVSLTGTGATTITGTYPSFTINSAAGGTGDVVGPASATNNNLAAFDGTTGKLIKQAAVVTVAQGGTGTATPSIVAGTNITVTGSFPNQTINSSSSGGSVTSVAVSGGTTGLTTSGGPITGAGTITLAGTLAVTNGGTSLATLTANNVIIGNGTAAPLFVAPSTSGNVLTSNGTTWASSLPAAGGISYTSVKTANYTAVNNDGVLTNTTAGGFTVTFPASPAVGNQILVVDAFNQWGNFPVIVDPTASQRIAGGTLADTLTLDIAGATVTFVYTGASYGWSVFAQVGGNGGTAVTLAGVQTLTNKTINGASNTLTVDGTNAVGFRNIPQNIQASAYTMVLGDSGNHIFHALGAAAATYTIPANSSVAYPIGTALTFINMAVAVVSIAITTDTLTLSSAGTTGTRSLAQFGSATCVKITSTSWLISGSGLS